MQFIWSEIPFQGLKWLVNWARRIYRKTDDDRWMNLWWIDEWIILSFFIVPHIFIWTEQHDRQLNGFATDRSFDQVAFCHIKMHNLQFVMQTSVHWISFCEFNFGTVLYSGGITLTSVCICRWLMFMHVCDVRPFSNFILTCRVQRIIFLNEEKYENTKKEKNL